jgi:hypothetical protein
MKVWLLAIPAMALLGARMRLSGRRWTDQRSIPAQPRERRVVP